MALYWYLDEVKDWENVCRLPVNPEWTAEQIANISYGTTVWEDDDGKATHIMSPVTDRLIWGLMGVGIPAITEQNFHEVWMRLCLVDAVTLGRVRATLEEVRAHVGLRTNAEKKSAAKFYADELRLIERKLRAANQAA